MDFQMSFLVYHPDVSLFIDEFNADPNVITAKNLLKYIDFINRNTYSIEYILSLIEKVVVQLCNSLHPYDILIYIYNAIESYIFFLQDQIDGSYQENLVDKIIKGTDGIYPFTFSQDMLYLEYIEETKNLKLIHILAQIIYIHSSTPQKFTLRFAYYIESILPYIKNEWKIILAREIIPEGKISSQPQYIQFLYYLLARYQLDRVQELKEYISNNLQGFLENKDLQSIILNMKEFNKNELHFHEYEIYSNEIRKILEIYAMNDPNMPSDYGPTIIEFIENAKKFGYINDSDNLYISEVFPSLIDKASLIKLDSKKIIEYFAKFDFENFQTFSNLFFELMKDKVIYDDKYLSNVFDKILWNMDFRTQRLLTQFVSENDIVRPALSNSIKNFIKNYDVEKLKIMPVFMLSRLYPILGKSFPDVDLEDLIYETMPSYYILNNLENLGKSYKLLHPEKLVQYVPPSPVLFTYLSNHVSDFSPIINWLIDQTCEYREYFDLLIKIWQIKRDPNIAWKIYQLFDVFERECDDSIIESIQNSEPDVILEKMCSNSAEFLVSWLDLFDLSGIDPNYLYNHLNEHPYLLFLANRLDEKFNFVFDQKLFSEMKNDSNIFKAFILDSALQIASNEWWGWIKQNPEILKLNFTEKDFKKSMVPISSTICKIFLKCLTKIDLLPDSEFANDSFILGAKNQSMDLCNETVDYIKVDKRILQTVFSQDYNRVCLLLLDRIGLKELSTTALEYASNTTLIPLVKKERRFLSDENLINKLPYIKQTEKYEDIVKFIVKNIEQTEENYHLIFDLIFSTKFTRLNISNISKIIFNMLPDAKWFDSYLNLHEFSSFSSERAIPVLSTMNEYAAHSLLVLSSIPFVVNNFDENSPLSNSLLELSLSTLLHINIDGLDLSFLDNFSDFETTFSYLLSLIPNNGSYDFIQQLLLDEFSYHYRELTKSNLLFLELKFNEKNQDFLRAISKTHLKFKKEDILSEELKATVQASTSAKYISAPKIICYKLTGDVPNGMTIPPIITNLFCPISTNYRLCSYVACGELELSTYICHHDVLLKFKSDQVEIKEDTDSNDRVLYVFYIREDLADQEIKHQLKPSEEFTNSAISYILSDKYSIDWSDMAKKRNVEQLSITLAKKYDNFNLFYLLDKSVPGYDDRFLESIGEVSSEFISKILVYSKDPETMRNKIINIQSNSE